MVADVNDVIVESKFHADEMALVVRARDAHIAELSSEVQRAQEKCAGIFLTWPARHLRSALVALTRRA